MKNSLLIFVLFLFATPIFSQISLHSGQVHPLVRKGTPAHPKNLSEFVFKLKNNQMDFVGGVTSTQWLQMVIDGFNEHSAERLGLKDLTISTALWIVEHSEVMATSSLNLKKDDYYSSGTANGNFFWILNPSVPDSVLVYTDSEGEWAVIAKWDCLNPTCDLRVAKPKPAPAPSTAPAARPKRIVVPDTIYETVVVRPKMVTVQLMFARYSPGGLCRTFSTSTTFEVEVKLDKDGPYFVESGGNIWRGYKKNTPFTYDDWVNCNCTSLDYYYVQGVGN